MAWAQNESARGLGDTRPTRDLNHWRSSSTRLDQRDRHVERGGHQPGDRSNSSSGVESSSPVAAGWRVEPPRRGSAGTSVSTSLPIGRAGPTVAVIRTVCRVSPRPLPARVLTAESAHCEPSGRRRRREPHCGPTAPGPFEDLGAPAEQLHRSLRSPAPTRTPVDPTGRAGGLEHPLTILGCDAPTFVAHVDRDPDPSERAAIVIFERAVRWTDFAALVTRLRMSSESGLADRTSGSWFWTWAGRAQLEPMVERTQAIRFERHGGGRGLRSG